MSDIHFTSLCKFSYSECGYSECGCSNKLQITYLFS